MGLEFTTSRLADAVAWARKFSLFQYPFVTACCGMEFMAVAAPKYDIARFGAEFPRFSPRQADLLIIVGTITEKMGPVLARIYEQMAEPKFVVAVGSCACSGGVFKGCYNVEGGIDEVIPVSAYIPGCAVRPEAIIDGVVKLLATLEVKDEPKVEAAPKGEAVAHG